MTNADYEDDLVLLSNIPAQAKSLLHWLEQAAGCISFHINENKIYFMCFKQERTILHPKWQTSEICRSVNIHWQQNSSNESDLNMNRLPLTDRGNLISNKIKRDFF